MHRQQFIQLNELLHHAFATTRFYQERLSGIGFKKDTHVTPDLFARIPLLQREDIQSSLADMNSHGVPKSHGKIGMAESSGSTGKPLKIYSTSVSQHFWEIFGLRDHLWHNRDFSKKHGSIRVGVTKPSTPHWGRAAHAVFSTGPNMLLNISEDMDAQIRWVQQTDPAYLLTYPSNLREMGKRCLDRGIVFPGLKELRTFGETVNPELRDICKQAWGLKIKDMYSAMEIGYMALQCPDHDHYHVMAEGVFLEILDDDGRPCKPGEIGRVVVTDLHNFATPMIRYEILDYAEVGEPCPCGRGLPVLKQIMGRQRNMMKLPGGKTIWPAFSPGQWPGAPEIRQLQIVQKEIDRLVIRLVMKHNPLSSEQESDIITIIQDRTGCPMHVDFEYTRTIEKPENFKFDMFVSEI